MSNNEEALSKAIVHLFDTDRFYAELILQMDRYVSKRIPTAGVRIKKNIELFVNPDFFDKLTLDERVAVLKHECQHILNDHIPRHKDMAPEVYAKQDKTGEDAVIDDIINNQKHKLLNIAADCSINPGIKNIMADGMFPKQFDLPDNMLMEWYAAQLKDNEKAKNITEFDGHLLWAESEGQKEELKEKLRKAIKDAATKTKGAGKLSSDMELMIDRLLYVPRDWKGDLRRFAARAMETAIESSKKKRNRRYGIMYPGSVKIETLHIGVATDTSGSVSDDALGQFMAEIANIAKYATVTVVEADSEVKNSYLFNPKKQYKITGRGGTAYQPAFDYFTEETDVDGVIYFGDMDCFDLEELKKPKYPVLWAIIGDQKPPADWGMQTKVEVKGRK